MCSINVIENQSSFFFIDVVRERVLSPCGEIVGGLRLRQAADCNATEGPGCKLLGVIDRCDATATQSDPTDQLLEL